MEYFNLTGLVSHAAALWPTTAEYEAAASDAGSWCTERVDDVADIVAQCLDSMDESFKRSRLTYGAIVTVCVLAITFFSVVCKLSAKIIRRRELGLAWGFRAPTLEQERAFATRIRTQLAIAPRDWFEEFKEPFVASLQELVTGITAEDALVTCSTEKAAVLRDVIHALLSPVRIANMTQWAYERSNTLVDMWLSQTESSGCFSPVNDSIHFLSQSYWELISGNKSAAELPPALQGLVSVFPISDDVSSRADKLDISGLVKALDTLSDDLEAVEGSLVHIMKAQGFERPAIISMLFTVYVATVGKTAIMTFTAIDRCALSPAVQDRPRTDIKEAVDASGLRDAIAGSKALEHLLVEAIRFGPKLPILPHNTDKLSRLESVVGANPARFRPQRFDGKLAAGWLELPFLPLGAGPRACPGAKHAQVSASQLLGTLLAKGVLESVYDSGFEVRLALRPVDG